MMTGDPRSKFGFVQYLRVRPRHVHQNIVLAMCKCGALVKNRFHALYGISFKQILGAIKCGVHETLERIVDCSRSFEIISYHTYGETHSTVAASRGSKVKN